MQLEEVKKILDSDGVDRTITRITHEILEKNKGTQDLLLIGIERGGAILAERLRSKIQSIEGVSVPKGSLDITLYRDDIDEIVNQPLMRGTHLEFDISGKKVILVDDVLYTGRTVRSALDALIDFGRPKWVQLAVMVDRGHRELPIRADYVGKNIPTSPEEDIQVVLSEVDSKDDEVVVRKGK